MTDHTDIVERLENFCTDWDGSAMNDNTTPMDGLHCVDLRQAAAEITRLRAEAEALRKDAERYRWLRDRLFGADWDWNNEGVPVVLFRWPDGASIGADLDAAIDAAKGTT